MKPRGFWGTFVTIAAITALPFALLWSLLFSLMVGLEFGQVLRVGIWSGIAFGLLFGFVMAFFMKAVTTSVTFQDKKAFLSRLNVALAEIGYYPESQTESFLTYKPSFRAGLLAGNVICSLRAGKEESMNRGLLYKILIVSFMCLYLLTTYSHAQFFPGTLIKIGKGGITQKIEISDNDKVIKNDKGEEIGRITNYDG
jgi:hypothetical protein